MMTSLFSVFDPSSGCFGLPLNWLSTFLGLVVVPYFFWAAPSRWIFVWNSVLLALYSEFRALLGVSRSQVGLLFVSLFSLIVYNNFLGLFPYVFTSSSHLAMTLALALPLWVSFMVYGWANHTQHMFAHLVPSGTPGLLMPFMVLIETISNVIRPGTLAVRLAANMMAGHLLLSLMGGAAVGIGSVVLFLLLSSQILLFILECAVAVIQSYVFAVLSTLYVSEVA